MLPACLCSALVKVQGLAIKEMSSKLRGSTKLPSSHWAGPTSLCPALIAGILHFHGAAVWVSF